MKKIIAILAALLMALTLTAMAEDYAALEGGVYTGADPWGGQLTVSFQAMFEDSMDWTFTDALDGMTLTQSFEGTPLRDGTAEFHLEGASLEADYETFDYTGTIALGDDMVIVTYTGGALTEHSENGGSTAYHVAALEEPDRAVALKPMPLQEAEAIDRLCDVWVDEDAAVEIWYDGAFHVRSTLGGDMSIDYARCSYDATEGTLSCEDGMRYSESYDETIQSVRTDVIVTGLTADFELIDDGAKLIWNDSEGICKRYELKRLAEAETEDWQEAQAFLGRWGQGRCTIDITEGERGDYHVNIAWSGSAWEQSVWDYDCVYDGVNKELRSYEPGTKTIQVWNDLGELDSVEVEYEDGEAVFTIDDQDLLTWDDKKENMAEDMRFERGIMM